MSNILNSFELGDKGERFVMNVFQGAKMGCCQNSDKTKRYDHDILCDFDGKEFTVECKFDKMAEKTGNWCIEVFNSRKNKPSGITVTKADFWCVILQDGENMVVYITTVKRLREFVSNTKPYKSFNNAGDNNAAILLYKHEDISPIFFRIDNITPEDFVKIISKLMQSM